MSSIHSKRIYCNLEKATTNNIRSKRYLFYIVVPTTDLVVTMIVKVNLLQDSGGFSTPPSPHSSGATQECSFEVFQLDGVPWPVFAARLTSQGWFWGNLFVRK
jgi:hypothetical protein